MQWDVRLHRAEMLINKHYSKLYNISFDVKKYDLYVQQKFDEFIVHNMIQSQKVYQ